MFGIDDETGRERAIFTTFRKKALAFSFRAKTTRRLFLCCFPSEGRNPKLETTDVSGQSIAVVPLQK
jgi:hypothetical protein